ncbi:TatD family hydrolase [Glaciecola sp. MH2013]|uniref:TatD family hydrolase n=1 Tax=Glaciecola sp. MH2013 TaxID=2785524 RepID=UPI00189D3AE6|nr:TatD family hydrolase [Glaciecola sp. MH2013]MBF7073820.1 TatD family hydrolase [Glaciecola sp. MH2013]
MRWFDIGVNLLDRRINNNDVLQRSLQAGVDHLCIISSNLAESQNAQSFVSSSTSKIHLSYTAGIHPHCADAASAADFTKIKTLCADKTMVAVGECGLDFNRNFSTKQNQLRVFESQLEIAAEYAKPIYLHEREAFDEQVELLERYLAHIPRAVVHCFTGSQSQLKTYLELGCYIGITGWLCDDKRASELQEAILSLPLDRLLLETDAPYLFPKNVRPRAKNNEPCYLPHIAQRYAELTQYEINDIAQASYRNAKAFFGLDTS